MVSVGDAVLDWLRLPYVEWALPIPVLAALAPVVWLVFRSTWRELDVAAAAYRHELEALGKTDWRPAAVFAFGGFVLIVQAKVGTTTIFSTHLLPALRAAAAESPSISGVLADYTDLLGRTWWAAFRVCGYLAPLLVWRLLFPADRILDMGLRVRGLREHVWIYALAVVVLVPLILLLARRPDFGRQYPIFREAGRSWVDFAAWEVLYIAQFFTLEVFFRGWWLRACRGLGSAAIFSMIAPYVLIHVNKPYLEGCAAIVAGVVLGSLSMRTGSIWAGFLVHSTVGVLMDVAALGAKGALPERLTALSERRLVFGGWNSVVWGCWGIAACTLAVWVAPHVRRWRPRSDRTHSSGP